MLQSLSLTTFRNYEKENFSFVQGLNGIFGDNGTGKTSILEAICFLSTGRSFRTQAAEEVIHAGSSGFSIDATLFSGSTLRLARHGEDKRVTINGSKHAMFSRIIGSLPTVIFAPKDIALISGSPLDRRRFLDILLSQKTPLYLHFLTRYARTLKQRNALLKQKKTDGLAAFNERLAHYGSKLIAYRIEAFEQLDSFVNAHYPDLATDKARVSISYAPSIAKTAESAYLDELNRSEKRDIVYQTTHVGPHRDDFSVLYNGQKAKQYASEGQKRSALAALKFAEYELLADESDIPVTFCIDDFSVHLDNSRINNLVKKLRSLPQVLITAPRAPQLAIDYEIQLAPLINNYQKKYW